MAHSPLHVSTTARPALSIGSGVSCSRRRRAAPNASPPAATPDACFTMGKWEAVILAILEVLEKLPQIKLSPLLNATFTARRNRLHLAEAEQKAPNRDVAYILATQQRFS